MTSLDESRIYPGRPLLAVSLAVFRGDRVLLAQRSAPPYAGRFTLPGGLVEPGEPLQAAALRELREEVAVEAEIVGFNRHVEVIQRDVGGMVERHYVIASFVARWRGGEGTVGREATAIQWARRDQVAGLPTTEHLMPLLERAWQIVEGTCVC